MLLQHVEAREVETVRGEGLAHLPQEVIVEALDAADQAHGGDVEVRSLVFPLLENPFHVIHAGRVGRD